MKLNVYALIFCLITGGMQLRAQTLVANIDQSNAGSSPEFLQSDGSYAVFTAADAEYDRQLYVISEAGGTPEPLADPATGAPVMNPYGVKLIDGNVYYYTHGEGLTTYYRAELATGTITELATLASPGANGGDPDFTPLSSRILFIHVTENYTRELYAFDPGTGQVFLLATLPGDSNLLGVVAAGNRAFLSFAYFPSDPVLFGVTDGTPEGSFIRYLEDGTLYLGSPVIFGNTFVVEGAGQTSSALYYYDTLSAALIPLRERVTNLPDGTLSQLQAADDLYFVRAGANLSRELWRIDSATYVAERVVDLNPLRDSVFLSQLQVFDDLIFYRLYGLADGRNSLYRTDGTPEGSVLLLDSISSRTSNGFSLGQVVATEDGYYFLADRPDSGTELWRTDGTATGTYLVKDLYPGSDDGDLSQLTGLGAELLFAATGPDYGSEVYRSDGTASGTVLVADLNTTETGSNPNRFFTFNDTLFFIARTGCTGFEPFKTGGTANSTSLLRDLTPGRESGYIFSTAQVGDRFYFSLTGTFPGSDTLYESDGTAAGTRPLETPGLPGDPPVIFSGPGAIGARLMVLGYFTGVGQALYSLDPKTGEAELLRVFSAGGANSSGSSFLPFRDSLLLFVQDTDDFGPELWRTNGTPEGTYQVEDIRRVNEPGFSNYHISNLTVIGDLAYFSADDGFGNRPYRSDGTEAGTYQLNGSDYLGAPHDFVEYAGRVYFAAGYSNAEGLFSTTGEMNDVVYSPINSGGDFSYFSDLTVLGTKLVFTALTPAQGMELWAAAGPESPAMLLGDLYSGPGDSYPRSLFVADSTTVLFSADVPEVGRELWSTDGTPQGTVLVADINPGTASSDPENFYAYGAFTYFAANDGQTGAELWKYSPADLDNDGYVGADDADETDPLVNAGTNGDPNLVGVSCAAPGDSTTAVAGAARPEFLIEVYPNPTTERLNVRAPGGRALRVELYARDGRVVQAAADIHTEYVLLVGHLPAGAYLLRVTDPADGRTGNQWVTIGK